MRWNSNKNAQADGGDWTGEKAWTVRKICDGRRTAEIGKSLAFTGLTLLIGALFIFLAGESPVKAYGSLVQGALGTPQSLANTTSKSIPLAFTDLAVTMGSRCDVLNIGAEGRLHAGAMASVITALYFNAFPAPLLLVVSILAEIAAGMLVSSVPGIFKARFNTNEVIVAIMLNYICTLFTPYLVDGPFKIEGSTAQTELIAEGIWFGKPVPRTQLTCALFLLLFVTAAVYIFLWKTSVGYQLRAVGANPSTSGTAGIRVNTFPIMSMTTSGGIAALVGITEVFGKYHRFIEGFFPSFGFTGIAVAILGRNHPAGVLLTALLFGIIDMGSSRMSRKTMISTNMVTVIQSLVILLVAAPELIRWSRKRGRHMDIVNNFIGLTLQPSVPIILGALCGAIAERGGIILLGVEGIMLVGAFAGAAGSYVAGSAMAGVLLSVVLGDMIDWFYALFCPKWKAHQPVVGVGINLFAGGITTAMLKAIWQTEGMSKPIPSISNLTIPGLSGIPVIGALFKDQSPYPYAMFLIMAAVWTVFCKTKFGLRYRVIGDQPYAVQTAGVQVNRYRYIAMIAAGSIVGLTGFYLSISQGNLFMADMTAGRGFMGLAVSILGGWQSLGSMGVGMILAVAQVTRFYLADVSIPSQFIQILSYRATLLVLLFVGKRVKGPEALGKLVD